MPVFFSPHSDIILTVLSVALLMAGITCIDLSREKSLSKDFSPLRYLGIALIILSVREWVGIIGLSVPDFVSWYPLAAIMQTIAGMFVLLAARGEAAGHGRRSGLVHIAISVVFLIILSVLMLPYFFRANPFSPGISPVSTTVFFLVKGSLFLVSLVFAYCAWRNPSSPTGDEKAAYAIFVLLSLIIFICYPPGLPAAARTTPTTINNIMQALFILRVILGFAMATLMWNLYAKSLDVVGRIRWWPLLFMFFIVIGGVLFISIFSSGYDKLVRKGLSASARNAASAIVPRALLEAADARGSANDPLVAHRIFGEARELAYFEGYSNVSIQVDALAHLKEGDVLVPVLDVVSNPAGGGWAKGGRPARELWNETSTQRLVIMKQGAKHLSPTLVTALIRDSEGRPVGAAVLTVSTADLALNMYVFRRLALLFMPPALFLLLLLLSGQQRSWLASHSVSRAEALRTGALGNDLTGVMILRGTKIVAVNQRCAEIAGIAKEDLIGADANEVFMKYSPGSVREATARRVRSAGGVSTFETEFTRPDGRVVCLLVFGRPLSDSPGDPYYLWESVDITRQKEMERELRDARDSLQMILDTMPVAVFVKDRQRRYTMINKVFANLLGFDSVEKLIGRTVVELLGAAVKTSEDNDEICVDMHGGTLVYDQTITVNGEERHLEVSKAMKWQGGDEDNYFIVGSAYDFTSRKKAEEAISAERHFLYQLINSLPLSVCFTDPDRIIRLCDKDFCREAGVSDPAEIVGRPFDDVAPYGPALPGEDERILAKGVGHSDYEFESVKNGRVRSFIMRRIAMTSAEGKTLGLIKAYWDTTALVAANRAAKTADRAKAAFLANMSHELRTPMNGIVGMADLIITHEAARPVIGLYAETIIKSAKTLQMVLDEVMAVATMDDADARLALNTAPFPLLALAEEAAQIVSCIVEAWGVELYFSYDFDLHSIYVGDARHLRQIMVQILTHCSRITLDKRIQLRLASTGLNDDGRVMLSISFLPDVGVTAKGLEERFKRPPPTEEEAAGLGNLGMFNERIGLPLAWRLVETMGGGLDVKMVNDRLFCEVTLPLASDGTGPASAPLNAPNLSPLRVLVATPDGFRSEAVRACLEYAGAETRHVDDREETIAILRRAKEAEAPFGLLVLDSRLVPTAELAGFLSTLPQTGSSGRMEVILIANSLQVQNLSGIGEDVDSLLVPPVCPSELWYKAGSLTGKGVGGGAEKFRQRTTRIARVVKIPAKVLLVEDNTVNQMVAMGILKRIGCKPVLARNGLEAVKRIVAGEMFDIIFMDCMMPEMNGYDATSNIRLHEKSLPGMKRNIIVALTANTVAGDREKCLAAGMDDYVTKPVTMDLLREALIKHCPDLVLMVDELAQ